MNARRLSEAATGGSTITAREIWGTELANGNIEFEGAFAQAFLQGRVRVQVAELRSPGKKSGPKTLDLRISALLMSGKPRINWSAVIDWSVLLLKLQAA